MTSVVRCRRQRWGIPGIDLLDERLAGGGSVREFVRKHGIQEPQVHFVAVPSVIAHLVERSCWRELLFLGRWRPKCARAARFVFDEWPSLDWLHQRHDATIVTPYADPSFDFADQLLAESELLRPYLGADECSNSILDNLKRFIRGTQHALHGGSKASYLKF